MKSFIQTFWENNSRHDRLPKQNYLTAKVQMADICVLGCLLSANIKVQSEFLRNRERNKLLVWPQRHCQ